jgi:HK97 family phage major capsid protein
MRLYNYEEFIESDTYIQEHIMDTKILNSRKKELLDAQEVMLKNAVDTKTALSAADEAAFANMTSELDAINTNITRYAAIEKGKSEVGSPREAAVVTENKAGSKFFALGGYRTPTAVNTTSEYVKGFWQSLKSKAEHERFLIQNASLGEAGSSAAGGALVPVETDPSIPALAIEETIARSLSRVITTSMNLALPYQAGKTVAALKAESNSGGTNAFATNAPTFATTTLASYVIGDSVYASWELLSDAKAASDFITADLQRAIRVKEENLFVNGSGTSQPQGYLGNGTTAAGASITSGAATLGINPIFDTVSSLNRAYYLNASWLVNRQEFNRLAKAQVAANQFQTYVTYGPSGQAALLGWNVAFSAEMPVYVASPAVSGSWMFGDFKSFAVIGDRDDSNIRIKVLDQVAALNGQTVVLGYRRTDQRILLAEAVVQLNTNG